MRGSPFFDGVRQIDGAVLDEPSKMPCFYYDCSPNAWTTTLTRILAARPMISDAR